MKFSSCLLCFRLASFLGAVAVSANENLPSAEDAQTLQLETVEKFLEVRSPSLIKSSSIETKSLSTVKKFDGTIKQYLYLPSTVDRANNETVLIWTSEGRLFFSKDHGTNWWERGSSDITSVHRSTTDDNQLYVFTDNTYSVRVSWDYGQYYKKISLPATPNMLQALTSETIVFHPNHPDWMIFTGTVPCEHDFVCPQSSFYSKDGGRRWYKMVDNSVSCLWIYGLKVATDENLIYCVQKDPGFDPSNGLTVSYSTDYYKTDGKPLNGLSSVTGIFLDKQFVIAAVLDEDNNQVLQISSDGLNFGEAKYPPDIKGDGKGALSVIATDDNTVMLFQSKYSQPGRDFGAIVRSGGLGTNFVTLLDNVNKESRMFGGYADYDIIRSAEGVALSNVVSNPADVINSGVSKKIATYITHSNGAMWSRLPAPAGSCDEFPDDCYLNLHGFSERLDPRNQPFSPTAVGLIMGRGNVGPSLTDLRKSQTFMSRDAGLTWRKVSDRPMYWEFGDSGSVVILIDSMEPTNAISYSLDEGDTWTDYKFWDTAVKVKNIATIPSGTSRKFIIFGEPPLDYGDISVAIQLDFSGLASRKCEDSDFEWWTPEHPQLGTQCFLGHITEYKRKKVESNCIVGKNYDGNSKTPTTSRRLSNCECSRDDYECDYGYILDSDSKNCKLVAGFSKPTKESQCTGGAIAWREVTGYRKYPGTTCEGGEVLENIQLYACPGKEREFNERFPNGEMPSEQLPNGPNNKPSIIGKFFWFVFKLVLTLLLIIGVGWCFWSLYTHFKDRHSLELSDLTSQVRLPSSSDFSSGRKMASEMAKEAFSAVISTWDLIRTHVPIFGPRRPQDHLGFYSRMDDDERHRILESDEFEEDLSEEDGSYEFNEGDEYHASSALNDHDPLDSIDPLGSPTPRGSFSDAPFTDDPDPSAHQSDHL